MNLADLESKSLSRRRFLEASVAAASAAAFPSMDARAQAPLKYHRVNVNDPVLGPPALASYKRAIKAMLELDAKDPRNWYRIAFTHALDCPHGNWWFLVWHRAYIGWFEKVCRELSGDPQFALPYWDWTQNLDATQPFKSAVPAVMFDDVLTPQNSAFIAKSADFHSRFREVIAKETYWNRVLDNTGVLAGDCQYAQLLARGIRFPEDLWFDIFDDPRGSFFFDQPRARGLTLAQPYLDPSTTKAVSRPTLLDALGPRDFITFASPKTYFHSGLTGFGVLEGQPHNLVHNNVGGLNGDQNVGGFMQNNLSPVDPLFFLHHANIDRLWDVWTRKQQARGYPHLPSGSDYTRWAAEPFVFFVDEKGLPLPAAKLKAGAYADIGEFNYEYQPGSGEEIVPLSAVLVEAVSAQQTPIAARLRIEPLGAASATIGVLDVPQNLLQASPEQGGPRLYVQIELDMPAISHVDFDVMINATAQESALGPSSPHHSATLSMFGHHTMHGPVTFTVALSGTLTALRARQLLAVDKPLNIQVVPRHHMSHHVMATPQASGPKAQVRSITLESR